MTILIGTKKLVKMARTWQRLVAISGKRITLPRPSNQEADASGGGGGGTSTSTAEKGCFVVYTTDSRRFALPLAYLKSGIFREILKLAEEEFGLPSNGPLTLPFDAVFMEYLLSLIRRNVANDILEKALLTTSTSNGRCFSSSSYLHQEQENPRLVLCGF
ncbi:hypothetical protein L484_014349 [Morus notabilis]|uniref:Auxin-induced protein 6B n=1 Tax=Morus notabilis TaxID=981085 RepID=W9RTN6_9ROSA|nr:auxin-responsive protein SAUR64 [Morus notabilis]EXB95376.1 hypothetical protein L484_014349 [Morus notabilis]